MALRKIRLLGDEILTKKAKPVKVVTPNLLMLLDDMADTMYHAYGVGLAAPQVGILKRVVVIDTTEDHSGKLELINPEILESSGSQTGEEGCLSVPGKFGIVTRPNYVKVRALDRNMKEFEVEGTELLARALVHELEHLDGHMFVEKVEGELEDVNAEKDEETRE